MNVVRYVKLLLYTSTDFDRGLLRLADLHYRLTASVTSQQGMLTCTPPRHQIQLVYPRTLSIHKMEFNDYMTQTDAI